jgi:hypothetical protein
MARTTAPSLWLPGFNPDTPESPTPQPLGEHVASTGASEPGEPVETTLVTTDATDVELAPAPARANWRVASATTEIAGRALWPPLRRSDVAGLNGPITKFEANIAAIEMLRWIEADDRRATAAERLVMLRYTGWGGVPASFNFEAEDKGWADRSRRLQALLTAEDHGSARASVNNSHYTGIHVIEGDVAGGGAIRLQWRADPGTRGRHRPLHRRDAASDCRAQHDDGHRDRPDLRPPAEGALCTRRCGRSHCPVGQWRTSLQGDVCTIPWSRAPWACRAHL